MTRCLTPDGMVQVDDTDPGIVYSGIWYTPDGPQDGWNNVQMNYNGTIHVSNSSGNTALFTYTGTSVEIWGGLGAILVNGMPVSYYILDGFGDNAYQPDRFAGSDYNYVPDMLFFRENDLYDDQHTLVIHHIQPPGVLDDEPGRTLPSFYFDFIRYKASNASSFPPCVPAAVRLASTATVTTPITTVTVRPSNYIPTVVGSAVGGLLVGALMAAVTGWYIGRRRAAKVPIMPYHTVRGSSPSADTTRRKTGETGQLTALPTLAVGDGRPSSSQVVGAPSPEASAGQSDAVNPSASTILPSHPPSGVVLSQARKAEHFAPPPSYTDD